MDPYGRDASSSPLVHVVQLGPGEPFPHLATLLKRPASQAEATPGPQMPVRAQELGHCTFMAIMAISIPVREIKTPIPSPHSDVDDAPPCPQTQRCACWRASDSRKNGRLFFPPERHSTWTPGGNIEHGAGGGGKFMNRHMGVFISRTGIA